MPIIQEEKFKRKELEKKRDSITVPLDSLFSRKELDEAKVIINQPKDTTAIKQLARIATIVIHDKKMMAILDVILNNRRRNKRLGIVDFD